MRILFDTNVLIDAAVQSRDHHDAANRLLVRAEQGDLNGLTTPTAIATCWYVSTATYGVDPRPLFEYLSAILDLAQMGWPALTDALKAPDDADFEDEYSGRRGAGRCRHRCDAEPGGFSRRTTDGLLPRGSE